MEKVVEKMGLYDVWTILFPGIVLIVSIKSIYNFMLSLPKLVNEAERSVERYLICCKMNIYIPKDVYELLIILILAYFGGLVLHEMSSLIKQKILYKKGEPISLLLDPVRGVFDEQQIQKFMPMFVFLNNGKAFTKSDKEKLKKESRNIFHKMNSELQSKDIANKYVKLNVIYNTCATLSVSVMVLFLMIVAFEIEFFFLKEYMQILYSFSLIILTIDIFFMLMNRSKRYYRYWTKNIVLAYEQIYLHDVQVEKK